MPTIKAQIIAALAQRLHARIAAPVELNRDAPVTVDATQPEHVTMLIGMAQYVHEDTGAVYYRMPVTCVGRVWDGTPAGAQLVAAALEGTVRDVVCADRTLGGLAVDVMESAGGLDDEAALAVTNGPPAHVFVLTFEVLFTTAPGNASQLGYAA